MEADRRDADSICEPAASGTHLAFEVEQRITSLLALSCNSAPSQVLRSAARMSTLCAGDVRRALLGGELRQPVSTPWRGKVGRSQVEFRFIGTAVHPGAPDDAQPSASQDADGVRVAATSSASCGIYGASPGVVME